MINQLAISKQSGVVLVIGLVFLLLMTIVGTAAIQNSTLQERMAGNASDRNEIFERAEIALQEGENAVITSNCDFLESNVQDQPNPNTPASWTGNIFEINEDAFEKDFDGAYVLTRIPAQQSEDESAAAESDPTCGGYYYVTAKAESDKGMTVVVQSTVFKRY